MLKSDHNDETATLVTKRVVLFALSLQTKGKLLVSIYLKNPGYHLIQWLFPVNTTTTITGIDKEKLEIIHDDGNTNE